MIWIVVLFFLSGLLVIPAVRALAGVLVVVALIGFVGTVLSSRPPAPVDISGMPTPEQVCAQDPNAEGLCRNGYPIPDGLDAPNSPR